MAYLELIGRMAQEKITLEMLATLLGIHRNSASRKVNGKSSFSIAEATLIRDTYFPGEPLETLFAKCEEVAECQN